MSDILGGLLGGGLGLFGSLIGKGSKVKVPEFVPVNADKVQADTINGNLANFDKAQILSSRVNNASFDELQNYLKRAIPGYEGIINGQADLIQKGLKGEIPSDVASAVKNKSASRALAGGYGGSGAARNLEARDLGLTSYDITNRSLEAATRYVTSMKSVAVPDLMSPASMFLSPSQRLNAQIGQNTEGYNSKLMQAQASAAPDPTMSAFGNFAGSLGGLLFRSAAPSIFSSGSDSGSYGPSSYNLLGNGQSGSFSSYRP